MKFLLVSLLSVLAISCADFESENFGKATDAAKFQKMSGDSFEHEDASKKLFLSVTSNKSIVQIAIYKKNSDGNPVNEEITTFTCSTSCISEVGSDNTYKAATTNSNSNEVIITKINKETNQSIITDRFILVRD